MTQPSQPESPAEIKTVTLLESDLPKLVMSGILSKSTAFTLRVDGPFGVREAQSILRLMQAQIEILELPGSPT